MKKFQEKKLAWEKKLKITDNYRTAFVRERDLIDILGFSRSHANKIINGHQKLSDAHTELLKIKMIGSIPDWPTGWYVIDGEISCPNGFMVNHVQLENFSFFMMLMKDISRDMKRLMDENKRLKEEIKSRSELRVYVNNSNKPQRTIKIVKK